MSLTHTKKAREAWGSRIGVVLAAAGCAVGLGNFLRFPGVAARNGGGAFMIPYFIAFIFLALPLCWMEWSMGRYGGRFGHGSAPGVFDAAGDRKHPWLKYLGVLGVTGALGIFFYYVYIESWTLAYSVFAFKGTYAAVQTPEQMGEFLGSYLSGQGRFFHSRLPAYGFFLATFAANFWVIYHGVSHGIERFCKVAMPLLLLTAAALVVHVFTLGAPVNPDWNIHSALGFLWNPDFAALKSGKVWLEAAGQVFFSTSVGIGVLLTYATYLKSRDDALLPATSACFLNEFCEVVLGGSIVVPAAYLFFGPHGTVQAVEGGTFGLAFRTTPLIFNHMAGGAWIGFCWFALLFIAGVTSSVSVLQPAVAFIEEEFGFNRKRCVIAIAGLAFAVAHLAIFGDGVVDEMDFWFSSFGLPLFGLFEALVFVFYFKPERGWRELHDGSELRLPAFFKPVVVYVTPAFLFTILAGWLATDGWKTILMRKLVDGRLVPLYSDAQVPWVIATRLFCLAFIAASCVLIHLAWKRRKAAAP
ncbi:MAG: sodium-dependent transporter [Verrucomicrobiota bacterium]|jgi:SNF family Na+-dependent transporter|nr:sodium-dependent transporter [Verrucomicrobiota bacterium]